MAAKTVDPMVRRSFLMWLALAPLLICNLFPFAVMISTALTPEQDIYAQGTQWIPETFTWRNFVDMWETVGFGGALVNSLIVGFITTVMTILVAVPAAYAMARRPFKGMQAFRIFLLITHFWVQHYNRTTASISHSVVTAEEAERGEMPEYRQEAADAVRAFQSRDSLRQSPGIVRAARTVGNVGKGFFPVESMNVAVHIG